MASIDQRIVELKFNAKNFKSGIQAAIASLDNLKKNLNMNKAASEFDKVEKASKGIKFNELSSNVESISQRFSTLGIIGMSALNQITTTAMQTGKKLLSALTSPLIEGGKRRALNIEQAKFQIQGLGYTWESVEDDINYGVKGTAYGLDAAAKAASQLLASQVKVGDEMKASLRGISGVAAMTSSEYEDIANIFTTVAGNGRLMGDQLMQLSSRGLNAAATLGQYLGKSEGEIREMVSKGKIDFATFAAAMDSAFGEHAKKANETFTGSLSNMKAALARIGAEVASPAYTHLRDIFNSLTPVIDGVKAALIADGGLIPAIKTGMSYVANFATQTLDSLGGEEGVAALLAPTLDKLTRILKAFGSLLLGVARTIKGVVAPIFSAFTEVLGGSLLDAIGGAIEILAKFVNSLAFTERMSSNLKKTFVGIFTVIDVLFKIITKVISVVTGVLFSAFSATFGFVLDVILAITGHLGDLIVRIHKFIKDLYKLKTVQDLLSGISAIFQKMKNIIATVYSAFRNLIGVIIDSTFDSALWLFDKIAGAILLIAKYLDKAITKLREFVKWLKSLPAVQNFVAKVKDTFYALQTNIGGVASDLKTRFIDAFNNAKNVISEFISHLKELISQYIELPTLQDVITTVVEFMTTTFEKAVELFNKAKEVLGNIFDRVKELNEVSLKGIIENFNKLKDKIIEVIDVSGRLAWLKDTFGSIRDGAVAAAQGTGSTLDLIKQKLIQFVEWAKDKFSKLTMGDVMAAGIGGTFIVFLVELTKMVKTADKLAGSIDKAVGSINKITGSITGAIDSFKELNKAKAQSIKMEAISDLIKSVVLLAGAVALLASMDPNRVMISAGVLLILAGGLIGLSAAMNVINKKVKPKSIAATATQMVAAAGSILILAAAIKLLSTIPVGQLIASLIAVGILMGEVIGFMVLMGKFAPQAIKESFSMLMVATSLIVLARAMSLIGALSAQEILSSMVVVSALMIGLGIMFKLSGEIAMSKNAAKGILAIVASLYLIIGAMKLLAGLDSSTVNTGLFRLIEVMGTLVLLMLATKFAGKYAASAGAAILLISIAMNIMVLAIKNMASIDDGTLKQATKSINEMLKIFALITLMTKFAGGEAVKAGASIMMMAGAIVIISGAMILLSRLSDEDLKRATTVVVAILGMFAIIVAATGQVKNCQKTILQITICLGMLVAAVAVLSLIEPRNILSASSAISMIIGTLSLLTASTGKIGTKAMGTVWSLVAVIGAISIMIAALAQVPNIEKALSAATSISELMIVVGGLAVAMSVFKVQSIPLGAILQIALAIDGVILIIGALVAVVGAINTYIPEFEQFLTAGIPIMQKIGQAIGEFVGGIIGGIAAGASAALVELANNLNAFIETLQPFLAQVSQVDDAAMDGAMKLVEMILMFAAADFIDSLSFWNNGKSSIESLAENLPLLGTAMNKFAKSLKGTDLAALAIGAQAARAIGEVGLVFSEGGLKGFILGDASKGLASLGKNLPELGKGLTNYSKSVSELNAEAVNNSVGPMRSLVEVVNLINGEGGLLQVLGGSTDIGTKALTENLKPLGEALTEYGKSVENVNTEAINNSIAPLKSVIEVGKLINAEGGLLQVLGGSTDIGTKALTENLKPLGKALTEYGKSVENVNAEAINNSIAPLQSLVEISNSIQGESGFLNLFGGSNEKALKALMTNLPPLGKALKDYGDKLDGMKTSLITRSVEPLRTLVEISNMIDKEGGTTWLFGGSSSEAINNFKKNLPGLGEAVKNYSDNVDGVDSGRVSVSTECLTMIINALKGSNEGISSIFGGSTSGGITSLKEHLPGLGEALKEYNNNVADMSSEQVNISVQALKDIINAVGTGAEYSESMRTFGFALKDFSEAFRDAVNNLDGLAYETIDVFIEALGRLREAIANFANNFPDISPALNNFINSLKSAASTGIQGFIMEFITATPQAIGAATAMANQTVEAILTRLTKAVSEFRNKGKELILNLANGMQSGQSYVTSAIEKLISQITTRLTRLASDLSHRGRQLIVNLANGMKSASNLVTSAFDSIISNLSSKASGKSSSFYNVGRDLMYGLKNGINDYAWSPQNAAYSIGQKVVQKLKEATGVQSPSKETMAVGRFLDMGLVIGITRYSSQVIGAVKGLAEDIIDEVNPLSSNFAFLEDVSPVITPTIDTSLVDQGISRLNSEFASAGSVPINLQGSYAAAAFNNMAVAKQLQAAEIQNGMKSQIINNYDMTQNNYSPKALSRIDIYRDTRNQFSRLKEVVNA